MSAAPPQPPRMDLTPEEKQRIYAEEKARLEAQDTIRREQGQARTEAEATRKAREKSQFEAMYEKFSRRFLILCGLMLVVAVIRIFTGEWFPSKDYNPRPPGDGRPAPPLEVVSNSPWDGSVSQVKAWMQSNLKDPDSLQVIEWGTVTRVKDGFLVRCKYRAKNSFGGYAVDDKVFHLDAAGHVKQVIDWRQ